MVGMWIPKTPASLRTGTAGGEAVFVKIDVSQEAEAQKLIDTAVENFGALHGVANNAGIAGEQVSFTGTSNEL